MERFDQMPDAELIARLHCLNNTEPEALDKLSARWVRKHYAPNRHLYTMREMADGGYIIVSGLIRVTNMDNGLSWYCGPGYFLGGEALIDRTFHTEEAITCTSCHLLAIGEWIRELADEHPKLKQALIDHFQRRNSEMNSHFGRMYRANKTGRLAVQLLNMARAIRPEIVCDDAARLPFSVDFWTTQEEIAAQIDMCRLTVRSALQTLRNVAAIHYPSREGEIRLPITLPPDCISRLESALKTLLS